VLAKPLALQYAEEDGPGSSACYVGGIAENKIGKAAPWFELGITPLRRPHIQRGRRTSDEGGELQLLYLPAKGLLLSFFPADKVALTSGENALTTYEFYAQKSHTASAWSGARSHFRRGRPRTAQQCARLTCAAFLPSTWGPLSFSILTVQANC
jgi:hypothetical protein